MKIQERLILDKRYIQGLTISNNGVDPNNDIDVQVGQCADQDSGLYLLTRTAILTKRLDATWTAGNAGGGMDTGVKGANQTYFCYLIRNLTTGAVDAVFTALASPIMPSGFTVKRRIGIVTTDGSANIRQFVMIENRVRYITHVIGANVNNVPVLNTDVGITGVPTGIRVGAELIFSCSAVNSNSMARGIMLPPGHTVPGESIQTYGGVQLFPDTNAAGAHGAGGFSGEVHWNLNQCNILTNNGQVRISVRVNGGGINYFVTVLGWDDITR